MNQYNQQIHLFHDIKKHLSIIDSLYQLGDIEQAKTYSDKIVNQMQIDTFPINCRVLKIMISDYIATCKEKEILFTYEIDPRISYQFMEEPDIITLYSNLLSNASEVSDKCSSPFIRFKLFIHNNMIITKISNNYVDKIDQSKNHFKSTKSSHLGLGIKNIIAIIDNLLTNAPSFLYHFYAHVKTKFTICSSK